MSELFCSKYDFLRERDENSKTLGLQWLIGEGHLQDGIYHMLLDQLKHLYNSFLFPRFKWCSHATDVTTQI